MCYEAEVNWIKNITKLAENREKFTCDKYSVFLLITVILKQLIELITCSFLAKIKE